jgi:flagellar biosynthetic protein FliP
MFSFCSIVNLCCVVVSLPFKLIFFVLVDGWTLVAGSLIQSYGT